MTRPGIVLLLSGFPRRSETFALQETLALSRQGLLTAIFATKPGDGLPPQPGSEELLDQVQWLPAGSASEQAATVIEQVAGKAVAGVHAYFAHTPTTVAMTVAERLQRSYSFSMHAKDARKVTPTELKRRARGAIRVIACNPDVASAIDDPAIPVQILPHGVDLQRFYPQPLAVEPPIRLLAVGRLVEKKGFDHLLRAVATLPLPFRLTIIGDGPEESHLRHLIETLGLADRVCLQPGITHSELPDAYAAAHLVVVPSVVDQNGDRDGLPNVVLEAMAAGRAVVARDVAAIGSAIVHGENGLLTPPGDAMALAAVLTHLAQQPALRTQLARNARQRMTQNFDLNGCTDRFCTLLATTYGL